VQMQQANVEHEKQDHRYLKKDAGRALLGDAAAAAGRRPVSRTGHRSVQGTQINTYA